MPFFRKRPVVIEALRWIGYNADETIAFMGFTPKLDGDRLIVPTLEGEMRARVGDWLIKGVKDELYPCRDDIFRATYERVDLSEPWPEIAP